MMKEMLIPMFMEAYDSSQSAWKAKSLLSPPTCRAHRTCITQHSAQVLSHATARRYSAVLEDFFLLDLKQMTKRIRVEEKSVPEPFLLLTVRAV